MSRCFQSSSPGPTTLSLIPRATRPSFWLSIRKPRSRSLKTLFRMKCTISVWLAPTNSMKGKSRVCRQVRKRLHFWTGAFGEGLAVLAAPGSPEVAPNQYGPPETKLGPRYEQFQPGSRSLERIFPRSDRRTLQGNAANQKAYTFFGDIQGLDTRLATRWRPCSSSFGRASLMECMLDRRLLLQRYNHAAEELNASGKDRLALWSPQVLKAVLPWEAAAN